MRTLSVCLLQFSKQSWALADFLWNYLHQTFQQNSYSSVLLAPHAGWIWHCIILGWNFHSQGWQERQEFLQKWPHLLPPQLDLNDKPDFEAVAVFSSFLCQCQQVNGQWGRHYTVQQLETRSSQRERCLWVFLISLVPCFCRSTAFCMWRFSLTKKYETLV